MKFSVRGPSYIDKKWKLAILGMIILIILVAPSYYFYQKYASLQKMLKNPQAARTKSTNEIIAKVAKHIELPKNETPELVTVSNVAKLAGLPFFKSAQNGDKVLLYKTSKMAYMYRPATDQLINAAPIVDPQAEIEVGAAASDSATAAASVLPVKVVVYNGTQVNGYGREVGQKITEVYPSATISEVTNAGERSYKSTVVIDLSGKNKAAAVAIAQGIGGRVTSKPPMEEAPSADILVIAGK